MAQLSCIDHISAIERLEVAALPGDETSDAPYLVTVELADPNGRLWSAIGGGGTLEEAIGFACGSAPSDHAWRIVRVADLYGD